MECMDPIGRDAPSRMTKKAFVMPAKAGISSLSSRISRLNRMDSIVPPAVPLQNDILSSNSLLKPVT